MSSEVQAMTVSTRILRPMRHSRAGCSRHPGERHRVSIGASVFRSLTQLRVLLLALLWTAAVAQAETFDLVSFDTPSGTRTQLSEVVGFTDAEPTTFVAYSLYKCVPGSSDPARDFADEWQLLVANHYSVTGELKSETVDWFGGWRLTMGAAKVWGEQQRNFVSLLNVFTGYGYKVSVLINYNDDLYRPKIDKFIASLKLQAPAAGDVAMPAVSTPTPPAGNVSTPPDQAVDAGSPSKLTANEWYRSVASNWNGDGYIHYRYRFHDDGSYRFVKQWWSEYHYQDYWFIEESGDYRIEGATLHLMPTKAEKILRDKAGNAKGRPEAMTLESSSYRYRFDRFMKETLILTPVSGQTTERDGKMFSYAGDGRSYYYEQPCHCEEWPEPADCP